MLGTIVPTARTGGNHKGSSLARAARRRHNVPGEATHKGRCVMAQQIRQYGTWPSPITPALLGDTIRLSDVQWDSDGATLVWLEGRGATGVLVMRQGTDAPRDVTSGLSVRGRVGYGGGDFTVAGGQVYFAGPEGRIYRAALSGGPARPITPGFGEAASPRVSADGRWLVYVHSYEGVDGLALVDTGGEAWPAKLAYGTDFVMQPAWHPAGKYLAYIAWNHPQMPWDGAELRLITLDYADGVPGIESVETLVGDTETAIFQPEFSPDGRYLAYISDRTGWGQLYLYDLTDGTHGMITEAEAEHGAPGWVQGIRQYGWSADSQAIYFIRGEGGGSSLWRYAVESGITAPITAFAPYTALSQVAVAPSGDQIAVIASAPDIPSRVVSAKLSASAPAIHRRSTAELLPLEQYARPQAVTWTGHDDGLVHGLYYPPTHPDYTGPGLPPLILRIHGGPTSQAKADFNGQAQFFTSRGFALLDVNYRGSTGYGREYMKLLCGHWGIYDVEDAVSGALHLAGEGKADPSKFVIMGGSAGGFTVLQALIDKPGFFKAGVCMYGVANQFLLATDTHKFEARYLDSLLGPLPEAAEVYRARSPYFHADKIVDPLIVFQGEDDQVVPRNQSDDIVRALARRGTPHEYHVFAGEGHGWRKPETIEAFYRLTLQFLTQYVIYA